MKGLPNLGNTCGVNALLQCIAACDCATLPEGGSDSPPSDKLVASLYDVLREIRKDMSDGGKHQVVGMPVLHGFLQGMFRQARGMFTPGEQMDITELWMFLANYLEEHVPIHAGAPPRTWPVSQVPGYEQLHLGAQRAMDTFCKRPSAWLRHVQGFLVSQLSCTHCPHASHTFEPFVTISLDLAPSVAEGMARWLHEANVEGGSCEGCKRPRCEASPGQRVVRFWTLPRMLVIAWKRFEYGQGYSTQKRTDPATIDPVLSFSAKSVIGPEFIFQNHMTATYDLIGFGAHHGNGHGGHYTAFVRDMRMDGQPWFHCDDDAVTRMPNDRMAGMLQQNKCAYLMFYVKRERGDQARTSGPRA